MQLADASTVSGHPRQNFNVLLPRFDTLDQTLEEMLQSEELPMPQKYLGLRKGRRNFGKQQRIVAEIFSNLEVAMTTWQRHADY